MEKLWERFFYSLEDKNPVNGLSRLVNNAETISDYMEAGGILSESTKKLSELKDGDKVLISEGCTHHRQCEDIGTVKIPGWIEEYTGVKPKYSFTSGGEFPEDPSGYTLIVHCGGCMLNEKQMHDRIARAKDAGVPIVNYGIAIAQMHNILKRSLSPFPDLAAMV